MSNRENYMRLKVDLKNSGLDLSKDRSATDEGSLWEATEAYLSPRGAVEKRPSFTRWGSCLFEPPNLIAADNEIVAPDLHNHEYWTEESRIETNSSIAWFNNSIQMSGWRNLTVYSERTWHRDVQPFESFSTISDFTLTFNITAKNLPDAAGYTTIKFAVKENELRTLQLRGGDTDSSGIYREISAGVWDRIEGSQLVFDGDPHTISITGNSTNIAIRIDDESWRLFIASWAYVNNTDEYYLQLHGNADATMGIDGNWTTNLSGMFLTDRFQAVDKPNISDIKTLRVSKSTGVDVYRTFAAGEKFMWVDYDNTGLWQILYRKKHKNTFIAEFRDGLVFIDYSDADDSQCIWYKASGEMVELTSAPSAKFGVEYEGRLFLAGNPADSRRLYYSGDRDPTTWVVPSSGEFVPYDDLLNAGYFDIPGSAKEKITYLNAKYFRTLVVGTEGTLWGITGTDPESFSRNVVSSDFGTAGPKTGVGEMNDIICLSHSGVASLKATDKYGDLGVSKQSYFVKELFDVGTINNRTLNPKNLPNAALHFFAPHSMLFLAAEGSKITTSYSKSVYVAKLPDMQWFGPWYEDITCMATLTLAVPTSEHVAIGTPSGEVKYLVYMQPNDFTSVISTAWLDGRSIDPSLVSMEKTWKNLRLTINPTGDWPITVKWRTENRSWESKTFQLVGKDAAVLGDDPEANTGTLKTTSDSEKLVLHTPVEMRGTALKVELSSSAKKMSLLDLDLDFHVSGFDKE